MACERANHGGWDEDDEGEIITRNPYYKFVRKFLYSRPNEDEYNLIEEWRETVGFRENHDWNRCV